MSSTYVWDNFETYRLTRAALESYLTTIYGPYEFYIEVRTSDPFLVFQADRTRS